MSHDNHNDRTNYSKISTTPAVVEQTEVETTPAIAIVDPEPELDNTPAAPAEPIDGIVSGCKKLNVRVVPSLTGDVVCVVAEGTSLMIDESESTNEWYRVYTEAGAEGYCMKKFVTIKQ